jgi:hypothetical protein
MGDGGRTGDGGTWWVAVCLFLSCLLLGGKEDRLSKDGGKVTVVEAP